MKEEEIIRSVNEKIEIVRQNKLKLMELNNLIGEITDGLIIFESGNRQLMDYIQRFDYEIILEATTIAFEKYFDEDDSIDNTLDKIGGTCHNITRQKCNRD